MTRYPIRRPLHFTLAWFIGLLTIGIIFNDAVVAVAGSIPRVRPGTVTGTSVAKPRAVPVVLPAQNFEALLTQIRATDAKLDQAGFYLRTYTNEQDVTRNEQDVTSNEQYRTNYVTLVDRCLELAWTYNSEARRYSVAQFQHVNLRAQIDRDDVTTDCKETPR